MTTALIIYQYYPIYREPLFTLLDASEKVEYRFALGSSTLRAGLPAADPLKLRDAAVVRNIWLGHRLPYGPFLWQSGTPRIALRAQEDVVILSGDWHNLSTWVSAAILRLRRRTVMFHTMGWRNGGSRPENAVKHIFYRLAHTLLLYGHRAASYAKSLGFKPHMLVVVGNSIMRAAEVVPSSHAEDVDPAMLETLGLDPALPTVICVSRLEPKRRAGLLVEAAAVLAEQGTRINVMLVGDCSVDHAQELMDQAELRGVPLAMLGSVFDPVELRALYALSNCAVIPGAAGLAVTQALGHGVPVVTGDDWNIQGPEVEAIRPGETGYLYRFGDTNSLASAIASALMLAQEESTAVACRTVVLREYTAEAQAAIIDEVVGDAAQGRRR